MLAQLVKFQVRIAQLRESDRGATTALIAIVIIVAVSTLGTNLNVVFNKVATSV